MRTEYTIKITNSKGKEDFSVYPKSIAEARFASAKNFYEAKGCKVEFFKVRYNGASFHDAVKIG